MGRTSVIALLTIGTLAGLPAPLLASDGCVEISAANVATTGNIAAPGCYVLTSDLLQGLAVAAPDVSIDLNGFTITPPSGSAITLNGPIDHLEIRNGTVHAIDTAAIQAPVSPGFPVDRIHVYRDLRIVSDAAAGVAYGMNDSLLLGVQFENVVIDAAGNGVEVIGTGGNCAVKHLRVHRCEIHSSEMAAIALIGAGGSSFTVNGFRAESSTLISESGLAAVFIDTTQIPNGGTAGEIHGAIHGCNLAAPSTSTGAVVYFAAALGTLHCTDNDLAATGASGPGTEYAFWAPAGGFITVIDNTSSAAVTPGGGGAPLATSGLVYSPALGYDTAMSTYLYSNFDVFAGQY